LLSFRNGRRAVRHRDRKRVTACYGRQSIRFSFGDDKRVVARLESRIIKDIGVPEGFLPAGALDEPLAGCGPAVFGNDGATLGIWKYDPISGEISDRPAVLSVPPASMDSKACGLSRRESAFPPRTTSGVFRSDRS